MRYEFLLGILDAICKEAPDLLSKKYAKSENDPEKINQARSRSFIHLYIKVMFGISDFLERERYITDNANDGGIDGYYINRESRIIYLIQSKFRNTKENFEEKKISIEEIIAMDADRILSGEQKDDAGNEYNGKIKQLQRDISQISDIARYTYQIVILANIKATDALSAKKIFPGYPVEIFDHEKTYKKLVFPVLCGTYFAASDITIPIDLSSKNAGSKISYSVKTKYSDCEITVLFVPAIEIARMMGKYKNSILKHNPRSYLALEGQKVNTAIRSTIIESKFNEFALFNNGITMLSDETDINEKIGQLNKAQLRVRNPQIINGGQTSYTLSQILQEHGSNASEIFGEKEVLLKVITVADCDTRAKLALIDEISTATNSQTPVIAADKLSNDEFHDAVQQKAFDISGLLYEKKRGEFSAGMKDGYVDKSKVIERNKFWRVYFCTKGNITLGAQKKLFLNNEFSDVNLNEERPFQLLRPALAALNAITPPRAGQKINQRALFGKVFAYIQIFHSNFPIPDTIEVKKEHIALLDMEWENFLREKEKEGKGVVKFKLKGSEGKREKFSEKMYSKCNTFEADVSSYFKRRALHYQDIKFKGLFR